MYQRLALVALYCLCGSACGEDPIDPPPAPDMQAVRDSFEHPTGRLTPETAAALVTTLSDSEGYLSTVDVLGQFFTQVVNSLATSQKASQPLRAASSGPVGVMRSALTLDGGAWARLRYVCGPPGVVDEAAYGATVLNVILNDPSLSALYWGRLTRCLIESADGPITIDAEIIIDASVSGELIASLQGTIEEAGVETLTDFAFRMRSDTIGLLQPIEDETFVLSLPRAGGNSLGLKDCAGDWTCDLDSTSCRFSSASGTCTPDLQEVSWP